MRGQLETSEYTSSANMFVQTGKQSAGCTIGADDGVSNKEQKGKQNELISQEMQSPASEEGSQALTSFYSMSPCTYNWHDLDESDTDDGKYVYHQPTRGQTVPTGSEPERGEIIGSITCFMLAEFIISLL